VADPPEKIWAIGQASSCLAPTFCGIDLMLGGIEFQFDLESSLVSRKALVFGGLDLMIGGVEVLGIDGIFLITKLIFVTLY
jgi:hypothetical protein